MLSDLRPVRRACSAPAERRVSPRAYRGRFGRPRGHGRGRRRSGETRSSRPLGDSRRPRPRAGLRRRSEKTEAICHGSGLANTGFATVNIVFNSAFFGRRGSTSLGCKPLAVRARRALTPQGTGASRSPHELPVGVGTAVSSATSRAAAVHSAMDLPIAGGNASGGDLIVPTVAHRWRAAAAPHTGPRTASR